MNAAAAEFSREAAAAPGTFMISVMMIIILAEENFFTFFLCMFTPNGCTRLRLPAAQFHVQSQMCLDLEQNVLLQES